MNLMKLEVRGSQVHLTGYVNVVDRYSRPIPSERGAFLEKVEPGTFQRALDTNPNVKMKFNHDRVLCDQKSGLSLREDNIGLYADATFSDDEVAEKARDGKLTGWSFGFYKRADNWLDDEHRELKDIYLDEVSVLDCTPAYIATSVEMRDGENSMFEVRNLDGITVEDVPEPQEEPEEAREESAGTTTETTEPEKSSRSRAKAIFTYYSYMEEND